MRTFALGDVHGNAKALKQVLDRSGFDFDNDTLIQLGDIVDGYPDVYECFEILSTIRNLILIEGNHDNWFKEYLTTGISATKFAQGGYGTAFSYLDRIDKGHLIIPIGGDSIGFKTALNPEDIPPMHQKLLREQHLYYIDNDNCFVHGGFNRHLEFKGQQPYIYMWDRDLWHTALSYKAMAEGLNGEAPSFKIKTQFKNIFIGHTSTTFWNTTLPMKAGNIINIDTGAGSKGVLTLMDVDTHEFYQSDTGLQLYPDYKYRR